MKNLPMIKCLIPRKIWRRKEMSTQKNLELLDLLCIITKRVQDFMSTNFRMVVSSREKHFKIMNLKSYDAFFFFIYLNVGTDK